MKVFSFTCLPRDLPWQAVGEENGEPRRSNGSRSEIVLVPRTMRLLDRPETDKLDLAADEIRIVISCDTILRADLL